MSAPALIYDGECPFCANYVELLKLRQTFPALTLVNAREEPEHPAVQKVRALRLLIDDGMALVDGDTIHHGAAAIHAISAHGPKSLFGRLNAVLFRSPSRSRLIYPWLRAGRNLAVRLLGRGKIGVLSRGLFCQRVRNARERFPFGSATQDGHNSIDPEAVSYTRTGRRRISPQSNRACSVARNPPA